MPALKTREELAAEITAQIAGFGSAVKANTDAMSGLSGRTLALEQAITGMRAGGGGPMFSKRADSWGGQVVEHARYKAWIENGKAGKVNLDIKAEVTTPSGVEQRDLVAPQRDTIQGLPQQVLTVRNLIPAIPTTSNLIDFVRQVSRDNKAAPVADAAQKPETDLGFELAAAPIRTIAHWVPCPKQTLDDLPGLAALIDSELTFGLRLVEEEQILFGDGTGQNLLGIVPQAEQWNGIIDIADENPLDRILAGIVQAQQSRLRSSGIIINDITWAELISLKDGEKRYLSGAAGGPFGAISTSLWTVPVLPTPSMPRGEALVGAFATGVRLADRQQPTVEISTEDRDNWIKNMVTIRAEERVALAVRVPSAFVFIDQLGAGTTG